MLTPRVRTSILVLLFLVAAPFGSLGGTAASNPPLVADAGNSAAGAIGDALALEATAFGGLAPYTFAWTLAGGGAPFSPATAAATTLDTSGLSAGRHAVTVTVTDADGSTSSDDVYIRVDGSTVLLKQTIQALPGVPDEIIGGGSGRVDQQTRDFPFTVAAGTTAIEADLTWGNSGFGSILGNDFDLALIDPNGNSATGNQGLTGNRQEHAEVANPAAGLWKARVMAYLSLPDRFTIEVRAAGAGAPPLPVVRPIGDANAHYVFGALDDQRVEATVTGGSSPAIVYWDVGPNGVPTRVGASPKFNLGVGVHDVRVKVIDNQGYEHHGTTSIEVVDAVDHVVRAGCTGLSPRPIAAMEFSASGGTCWMHGGHHTYDLGGSFTLVSGHGYTAAVEMVYAPPKEDTGEGDPFLAPIHVATSPDGLTWAPLTFITYDVLGSVWQSSVFTFGASADPFRFIRIHNPQSATEGLSGFLDNSQFTLYANEAPATPGAAPTAGTRDLSCADGDHMEDFFAEHPCWFGGIDRYDSPSMLHTYPLGPGATVDHISGTFTVAPWRTDDWFSPLVPAPEQVYGTIVTIETSTDGTTWTAQGAVDALFGVPTSFNLTLPSSTGASFVRLIPDGHPRFDQHAAFAPNHHLEAYFLDSGISVTGVF